MVIIQNIGEILMNNIWHDISDERIKPDNFMVVIEISKGSKKKYELDKDTGMLRLDRILHTSVQYPSNYGFIPRTLSADGDALDVLVLCSESLDPMTIVRCYPIGVIVMNDNGVEDEKIIAIPYKDPHYNIYKDITKLPKHISQEIVHFLKVYKDLEERHEIVVGEMQTSTVAKKMIKDAKTAYAKPVNKKQ